ncbi:MAG: DEAD/DEAH box helicase [Bacteroidales bacterium]|nr:DEAD/DEAH box helicase [Bacteroidales bacterium]
MEILLKQLGIESLNSMQKKVLSLKLQFQDLVLLAPTGSGKTLAYLLPILSLLKEPGVLKVLIIAPTRELTLQIEKVFNEMNTSWKVVCCYGGHAFSIEKSAIKNKKPEVIIGTPGRLLDHLSKGSFNPDTLDLFIIDEFDKALELGFQEEMKKIILHLKYIKRRMLISATKMEDIPDFTGVENPTLLDFLNSDRNEPEKLSYNLVYSKEVDKIDTLYHLLGSFKEGSSIIFCNHRESVDRVGFLLSERGVVCETYHGGQEQLVRERSLAKFKNGSALVLIATDLASRGLDIEQVRHIIHYHIPLDSETFVHRNGRTARWNAKGEIYMILNEKETVPNFITEHFIPYSLEDKAIIYHKPEWTTLYIGKGSKDKISRGDVAGFLYKQGKLNKDDLGVIDLQDHCTFVAVRRSKVKQLLSLVQNEKLKGIKTIIEEAK